MDYIDMDKKINQDPVDDSLEERDGYLQEYQKSYEDTQDLSNIIMEINNGN